MAHSVTNTLTLQRFQNIGSGTAAGGRTVNLGFTPTVGRKLKVLASVFDVNSNAASLSGVSHDGNAMSLITGSRVQFGTSSRQAVEAWEITITSTVTTLILTLPQASGMYVSVSVVEVSGLGLLDEIKTATATATSLTVTADNANDQANNLILAVISRHGFSGATFGTPSGYTAIGTESDGGNYAAIQSCRKSITGAETSSVQWTGIASGPLGGLLMVFKDSNPPAFSAGPSVPSQTSTAFTVGCTPSVSSTFYVAAVPTSTSTPSAAQIKAGTGGGILFANNKAITGADTLTLTIAGTARPKYKICCLLSNADGDSSISVLNNEYRDPNTGRQWQQLASSPTGEFADLIATLGITAAAGDVVDLAILTDAPGSHAITPDSNGDMVFDLGGDTARQHFTWTFYDDSADVLSGPHDYYLNNVPAVWNTVPSIVGVVGTPISTINLSTNASHATDTLAFSVQSGSLTSGLGLVSPNISGTPLASSSSAVTLRATDDAGDYTDQVVSQNITDPVFPPNVVGVVYDDGTANDAISLIEDEGLVVGSVILEYNADPLYPHGVVFFQSPNHLTEVVLGAAVNLKVSLGPVPEYDLDSGRRCFGFGFGFG